MPAVIRIPGQHRVHTGDDLAGDDWSERLSITYRWADGQLNRLPALASELVASSVSVIIALGPASWAAKRATSTIPIVMAFSSDPVGNGVVSNLARPGGNTTGFSYMSTDLQKARFNSLRADPAGNYRKPAAVVVDQEHSLPHERGKTISSSTSVAPPQQNEE